MVTKKYRYGAGAILVPFFIFGANNENIYIGLSRFKAVIDKKTKKI